jgi:hypothetical protein
MAFFADPGVGHQRARLIPWQFGLDVEDREPCILLTGVARRRQEASLNSMKRKVSRSVSSIASTAWETIALITSSDRAGPARAVARTDVPGGATVTEQFAGWRQDGTPLVSSVISLPS